MKNIYVLWLKFLRFWHVIDASCYSHSGNYFALMDSRTAIARLDAEIDRIEVML